MSGPGKYDIFLRPALRPSRVLLPENIHEAAHKISVPNFLSKCPYNTVDCMISSAQVSKAKTYISGHGHGGGAGFGLGGLGLGPRTLTFGGGVGGVRGLGGGASVSIDIPIGLVMIKVMFEDCVMGLFWNICELDWLSLLIIGWS